MKCPYCGSNNIRVIDSRDTREGLIKRRRECIDCGKRFSTIETIIKLDLQVKKSSGKIEDFELEKIKKGLLKACDKRPVTLEEIDNITNRVIERLKEIDDEVISSETIGKVVLEELRKTDEIAFLKFAIVHKKYSSLGEFLNDINNLIGENGKV